MTSDLARLHEDEEAEDTVCIQQLRPAGAELPVQILGGHLLRLPLLVRPQLAGRQRGQAGVAAMFPLVKVLCDLRLVQ